MSLYRPDENYSVKQFLADKFGNAEPGAHEAHIWRAAETKQFLNSAPFAIRNYFKIADKHKGLVNINPFVGQAVLSVCIESQRRKGYPQRVVEDKPRQIGWTSWCLGEALHVALQPNSKAIVLVNDEDVANAKATILATMVNGLPSHMQPKRRIQNLKHLFFDNPNPKDRIFSPGLNSEVQVTVPSGMRGTTPHIVVVSEYAFMDENRKNEVNEGLLSAMAMQTHSCVIIDTTANGFDDDYYPMVMDACERNRKWIRKLETTVHITADEVFAGRLGEPDRPDGGWVPAFTPWFVHDEYTTRNESPRGEWPRVKKTDFEEFLADIGKSSKYDDGDEGDLYERGVSPFRLWWRRRKIDSLQQASQELKLLVFRQEFPTTVEGSFVNYEKSPFDRECLNAVARQQEEPRARGLLRQEGNTIGIDTTYHSDWQEVRIYAPPSSDEQYSMGVDTGIRYGYVEADAWVAQVVRWRDNKQVAVYEARVDEHQFREQIMLLYRWYNNAYTGIELQGSGFRLIRTLIDAGMRHYYCWKRLDREFPEPNENPYPGWETNDKTRPLMDDTLIELICRRDPQNQKPDPDIIIPDAKTLKELQSVRRQPSGKIKADKGHDDHVDALAIALCVARDPWGGFHRRHRDDSPPPKPPDNYSLFTQRWRGGSVGGRIDRNHPSLEYM